MATLYDAQFYADQSDGSARSAARVVPLIRDILEDPRSVLDVGCGVGTWAAAWQSSGVGDIVGLDGEYVNQDSLRIPGEKFLATDLSVSFDLQRRFDLVMSLEVAEHLPLASAACFVESLVRHGDVVLFSAAVPGQGGTDHINEQWPSYWASLFMSHRYFPLDIIRPIVWHDEQIDPWYRQNMLLFVREGTEIVGSEGGHSHPLDIAHPALFEQYACSSSVRLIARRVRSIRVMKTVDGFVRRLRMHRR